MGGGTLLSKGGGSRQARVQVGHAARCAWRVGWSPAVPPAHSDFGVVVVCGVCVCVGGGGGFKRARFHPTGTLGNAAPQANRRSHEAERLGKGLAAPRSGDGHAECRVGHVSAAHGGGTPPTGSATVPTLSVVIIFNQCGSARTSTCMLSESTAHRCSRDVQARLGGRVPVRPALPPKLRARRCAMAPG